MAQKKTQNGLESIAPIPELPQEIIDAINVQKFYLFTGAGVSKLYGYPLWWDLAIELVEKCFQKKFISRSKKETLLKSDFNPLELVTIANQELGKDETYRVLKKRLSLNMLKKKANHALKEKSEKIARLLSHYSSPIITTNADLSLDESKAFKGKFAIENFEKWDRNKNFNKIYHLHGSINDQESLIFTAEKYAKAYRNGSIFGNNLHSLFSENRTILFVGYGMREFELIRYFLSPDADQKRNLFMLQGYLDKDRLKYELDKEYFGSLGIDVLYYSIEGKGYDALVDVLETWDQRIVAETFVGKNELEDIAKAVSSKPTKKSLEYIERLL